MNKIKLSILITAILACVIDNGSARLHMPLPAHRLNITTISGFGSMAFPSDSACDFSKANLGATVERRYIRHSDSTMYETERGRSTLLLARGDTLLVMSEGRPGSRMTASLPRQFPYLHGGAPRQGYFDNTGVDGTGINQRHYGFWAEHAPRQCTVITPDGDTVTNAMLMQYSFASGFRQSPDPLDSILRADIQLERHDFGRDSISLNALLSFFYIDNCRYPLLQTEEYAMYAFGSLADSLSVGYYYPTDRQIAEVGAVEPPAAPNRTKTRLASVENVEWSEVSCTLYPTLFTNKVYLDIKGDDFGHYKVAFHSLEGKTMLLSSTGAGMAIDTSDLPRGTYVVEVTDGERRFTQKLIRL